MTPEQRMAAVLAEEDRYDAWDSEFTPNPYNPWGPAEALAIPDAIPYLTKTLTETKRRGRKWAVYALGRLGSVASSAAPVLEIQHLWCTLFLVDPARAYELGVHRKREAPDKIESFCSSVRGEIAEVAGKAEDPAQSRAHFARLLLESDVDLLLFALDGLQRDTSRMRDLAGKGAERIPVDEVRQLLYHLNEDVVAAAVQILVDLHLPEDGERVIHVMRTRTIRVHRVAEWAAGVPGSDVLLDRAGPLELYDLVRRRRCAGLWTDARFVRPRVLEMLGPVAPTKAWNDNAGRLMDVGNAANIVRELRDPACTEALIEAIGPTAASPYEPRLDDLVPAFVAIGAAADLALAAARKRLSGAHAQRLEWVIERFIVAAKAAPWSTLERADEHFSEGHLEDWLMDNAAYTHYAEVLARDAKSKHAAVQLAWIDRGFGTPITTQRIAWLRSLGVDEAMLDELARRPGAILHGGRSTHKMSRAEISRPRGRAAEQAGLYPIAARYFGLESADGLRNAEATRQHLERVRSL